MTTKKKKAIQPESKPPEAAEPKLDAASETEAAVEAEIEAEIAAAADEKLEAAIAEIEAEIELEAEDAPEPEADDSLEPEGSPESEEDDPGFTPKPRPPAKLERLQKILARAGVASRRSAEAMIEQGRVQVNGKIVTELGTKADGGRDHIRVDGKLLQGAERLRYFVLNKPKGFVTTVKDPEGRPTVMQFFDKMKERLYPVGRLDYMSEGLLVVTNDGDLANRLTKASSGVEKTYLVKVAGQPTEDQLDILRGGVAIERGKPGSPQVRTSPARIRQVRQGDNPWYEVVLIEGRNRELRKMFEEIGHFVEKIRRTGYGPLVLDQEPGNMRELEPGELDLLRKASEGKLRTPKAKDLRRRNAADAGILPTVLPKPSGRPRIAVPPAVPLDATRSSPDLSNSARPNSARPGEFRPKKFGSDRPVRGAAPFAKTGDKPFRPAAGRTPDRGPARTDDRDGPYRAAGAGAAKFGSAPRPAWTKDDRPTRPPTRFAADSGGSGPSAPVRSAPDRPASARPVPARPVFDRSRGASAGPGSIGTGRTGGDRPFKAKPAWKKTDRPDRPARPDFKRPAPPRHEVRDFDDDLGPVRPPNLHIEEIQGPSPSDRPARSERPSSYRPNSRPNAQPDSRPNSRPSAPRPYADRPKPIRPSSDRPTSARPSSNRPFSSEGGLPRAFTSSSGKPRAGGARPSSKAGKPAFGSGSRGSGPSPRSGPRSIEARTGSGYRPQPGGKRSYDGPSGGRSSAGPAKRSFGRGEGAGSFSPRSPRPAAGSGPRPSKPFTPRTEGASDYRPTKAKPYSSSTPRAERKAGPGWKPKPSFGGGGKPTSGGRSKSKPGGFSKSGYKGKPGASGGKRTGGKPGGKRRA